MVARFQKKCSRKFKEGGGRKKTQLCYRDGWPLTWEQRWRASWQRCAGALTTLPVLGVDQWRRTTGHPGMQSQQTSCWQQIFRLLPLWWYYFSLLLFGTYLQTELNRQLQFFFFYFKSRAKLHHPQWNHSKQWQTMPVHRFQWLPPCEITIRSWIIKKNFLSYHL